MSTIVSAHRTSLAKLFRRYDSDIFFILGVAALVVWGVYELRSGTSSGPSSTRPVAEVPHETAADMLRAAVSAEGRGNHRSALDHARQITLRFAGSAEAESAKMMVPRLEAALAVEAEAKEKMRLAGLWSYDIYKDAMTSKVTRSAVISSANSVSFDFPYHGEQNATLTLRIHPTYGRDVIFRIQQGQLLCSSWDGCSVRVRFDEQAPRRWHASPAADNSTEFLFLSNYEGFLRGLRAAKVVRIQPVVYQEGSPVFDFHVSGFRQDNFMGPAKQ
jgi:hypothetical protein